MNSASSGDHNPESAKPSTSAPLLGAPSSSQQDSDANMNSVAMNESKGAIPKAKKTNNNIDELASEHKKNGHADAVPKVSSSTSNYLNHSDSEHDFEQFNGRLNIPMDGPEVYNSTGIPLNSSEACIDLNRQFSSGHHNVESLTDNSSSSDDNELLSISDDGCIYTYKGDHHQDADLPSSFFIPEALPIEESPANVCRGENSSPEMDFLEMDFDPGPSGDADSDSLVSNHELNATANPPSEEPRKAVDEPKPCCSKDRYKEIEPENIDNQPKHLNLTKNIAEPVKKDVVPRADCSEVKLEVKMPWSCSIEDRTKAIKPLRSIKKHHSSKGELSSPSEMVLGNDISVSNLISFHNATGKVLIDDKIESNEDRSMVWSHHEACLKQITQVGPSACGATAILNVLSALKFPIPPIEKVQECVNTNFRANASPLCEYLLSRSRAGCTHRDLIEGLYTLSNKQLYGRFFAMHPERLVNLRSWLGYWIRNGAIPIATLNLQQCDGPIPDSWHHQMIFGVGPEGIYLTNPLECVDPGHLWPQLVSESVLLVRTVDVISRWNIKTDIPQLMQIDDVRWKELNVIGQVAKVVRENRTESRDAFTTHIKIPAEYKAGITLVINFDSPSYPLLRQCPELPLLQPEYASSAL